MGVDVQNTLSEATKMRKPKGIDKYGTLVKSPDPYLTPDQLNLTMAIAGAVGFLLAVILL